MKRLLIILTAWLGLTSVCSAQLTLDLVEYWKFDEASGNLVAAHSTNTLTETSGTIGTTTGKINGARLFERAASEWFELADNAALSTGDIDFSFACWFNRDTVGVYPVIVSKDGNSTSLNEYLCYVSSDTNIATFAVYDSSNNVNFVEWGSAISDDTWYFIAFGHNASSNDIWISVNGGTPVTAAHTTGVRDGTQAFQVGAGSARGLYFDGNLDEMGFWKRDIRSNISSLYNGGSGLAYPFATPPTITTSATQSIQESKRLVCELEATGSDPKTWTIAGGVDQEHFEVTMVGGDPWLSMPGSADYETPEDDDLNNTYVVDVNAENSEGDDDLTITVTVTDEGGGSVDPLGGGLIQ